MSNTKHYLWSAVGKFGTEILGFTGNILIARVLVPDDYGLVAMLAIFMSLAMNLTDSGFNDGLIRKKNSDKRDFGTVATFNIIVALTLYIVLYIAAPYISLFFHREELVGITRVLAIAFVLKSFSLSGFTQLIKSLQFKTTTIISLYSSIFSITCTYLMALCGFGYWALAFQPIAVAIGNIVLLLWIAKWKPYYCFSFSCFKEMFAFSSNLLISYIITNVGNNIYGFVIGKFYKLSDLGFYNQAHKMMSVPAQGLNSIILGTSYPIIAKETDLDKRYRLYVSLFENFNFLVTLMVFALILSSDFIFEVLFGEKWMPSSPLFKLFILTVLTYPFFTINSNIIKVQGNSNIYRNLSFVRAGTQIVAIAICASFSLKAIIIGQIIASFLSASVYMYYCGRTIGLKIGKQYGIWFSIIWKPLLAFMIGTVIASFVVNRNTSFLVAIVSYILTCITLCEATKDTTYTIYKNKLILIVKQLF